MVYRRMYKRPHLHLFSFPSIIFCLAFLFLIFQAGVHAQDIEAERKEKQSQLQVKIQENQIKIRKLQSGIEDQQKGVLQTQEKERSILSDIENLDQNLHKMTRRLSDLDHRMQEQQSLIFSLENQLQEIRTKSTAVQRHVEKRISAYYKLGKIDLMNITFSTRTLPELLRFHDSFQNVIEYDQQVMTDYHKIIRELESTHESLGLEKGLLEEFITQAQSKKEAISQAREEKELLLENVKNQAVLHEQAIEELKSATQNLAESLLKMKKQEKLYDQGFFLNKGRHIAPVTGTISSLFNEERINHFGITRKNPGISMEAEDGEKIHAIFDGKVIYAGYLKGYGNTVIIDHGYNYFSVTSRIERYITAKGARVKKNTVIGIMGSTATILDSGLYFEIRHNDQPLDPLEWLDNKKLKFANGHKKPSHTTAGQL